VNPQAGTVKLLEHFVTVRTVHLRVLCMVSGHAVKGHQPTEKSCYEKYKFKLQSTVPGAVAVPAG
jgi:hypothetical protein